MRPYNNRDLERIIGWVDNPFTSDDDTTRWAKDILASGFDDGGVPILFRIPLSESSLTYLRDAGVDLAIRDPYGQTLLFDDTHIDDSAFDELVKYFDDRKLIDLPDYEGITALSHYVKFGNYRRSLTLLKHGASPNSRAEIPRHGGASLSVAKQAILAMTSGEGEKDEDLKIKLLSALKLFGMTATHEEKGELLESAKLLGYGKVRNWIIDNL